MLNIAKSFAGFVIAITQVTENFMVVSTAEECSNPLVKTSTGKLYLDCTYDDIEKLPMGYDSANIEILNISYTKITRFRESDFDAFKKLQVLEMKNLDLKYEDSFPEGLFKGLLQLEHLDISGLIGAYKMPTKWPVSLKYFHLNELQKEEQFDFSVLDNLTELHMAQTNCPNLPKLSDTAPLVRINLFLSKRMDYLHYENISKFCLLNELNIHPDIAINNVPYHQEQCCGINKWTATFNIKGIHPELYCYTGCKDINIQISSAAIEERNECLVRHGLRLRKLWINLIIFLIAFLIVTMLALIAYGIYSRYYLNPPAIDEFVDKEKMEEEEEIGSVTSVDESSIKSS